ncbi:hypothetical protein T492DRAFT_859283 [Pavlovales sp. CCMP2436]|nr:hypothetical protein T492DRAFT_859283 [Pavlovales sp. CCMP2436]
MLCWSERCVAHCLLRALVGCAGLGATAPTVDKVDLITQAINDDPFKNQNSDDKAYLFSFHRAPALRPAPCTRKQRRLCSALGFLRIFHFYRTGPRQRARVPHPAAQFFVLCTREQVHGIQNPVASQQHADGETTDELVRSRTVARPRVVGRQFDPFGSRSNSFGSLFNQSRRRRFVFGFLIIHHFY